MAGRKVRFAMGQLLVEGGEPERNLARAEIMVAEAAKAKAELVLLPETLDLAWTHPSAMTEAAPIPGLRSDRLASAAKKHGVWICAGLTESDGDKRYNTAVLIDRGGNIVRTHRKINLLDVEWPFYTVGTSLSCVDTEFGRIGLNVCADNYLDSLHIGHALARMGAQVILSPSSWTVDYKLTEEDDPYRDKWLKPYRILAELYGLVVIGCTSVGYIVGGPYEGKKMVGSSLAVSEHGVLAKGPVNEFAGELVLVDFDIPERAEQGTAIGKRLKERGYQFDNLPGEDRVVESAEKSGFWSRKLVSRAKGEVPMPSGGPSSARPSAVTMCRRCIVDTTVPGTSFDSSGMCSYCRLHDAMEKEYPNDERGFAVLNRFLGQVKAGGKGRKFDCVMGISGGRDSTYSLYLAVKKWGLRPLAVHFNDGFGNPVAGENMRKATNRLGVELRTITSDWRESKDLKIAFLKASTPDMEEGTDIGIATALYGVACREHVKHIIIGQSFRTEGIAPLEWNYLDGKYLKAVHRRFGSVPLRGWHPYDPGFNLDLRHMFYYSVLKRIKVLPLLYYCDYVRPEAEKILIGELDWIYPGAHYYDDLYQSFMSYVYRVKFGIDRRKFNYSALVRSGQMTREDALKSIETPYVIEDEKVIDLCIKRLGLTREEVDQMLDEPVRTFRDYPNSYAVLKLARPGIRVLSMLNLVPRVTYDKYFNCG